MTNIQQSKSFSHERTNQMKIPQLLQNLSGNFAANSKLSSINEDTIYELSDDNFQMIEDKYRVNLQIKSNINVLKEQVRTLQRFERKSTEIEENIARLQRNQIKLQQLII
ncbi:Hypothetical_protein [Hexamita inflata]|uniref:Hypothetical_protein n=1 Tax=Hexamita inflata TaxID=28002 RepID=A0AA86NT51_9EUKA|nr:Hypothetical protein HINF_LOCUS12621 [Hexamita inflata]CAI9945373.1 Hypothetical protein HINF_LOCUS33018 [Hexamita inflata]